MNYRDCPRLPALSSFRQFVQARVPAVVSKGAGA